MKRESNLTESGLEVRDTFTDRDKELMLLIDSGNGLYRKSSSLDGYDDELDALIKHGYVIQRHLNYHVSPDGKLYIKQFQKPNQ